MRVTTATMTMCLAACCYAGLASGCSASDGEEPGESDDGGGKGDDAGDDGEAAIELLRSEEAFAELDPSRQDALERLVRPPLNVLSKNARTELDRLLDDPDYRALPVAEQAERLWGLAHLPVDIASPNPDGTYPGVLPPLAQFVVPLASASRPMELGQPVVSTRVGAPPPRDPEALLAKMAVLLDPAARPGPEDLIGPEDYEDAPEDCAEFPIIVDGESFLITAPLDGGLPPDPAQRGQFDADKGSGGMPLVGHSVQEVAEAVAQLPAANRALLQQVDLHAHRNPMDLLYATLYGRADFRAYMSALIHPIGTIGVFPQPGLEQATDPNTLAHESGHVWTFLEFGLDPSSDGWREWLAAAQADQLAVSSYADSSFLEDTAEMVLLISAVRSMGAEGEALAEELRSLFPQRWAILERELPAPR